MFEDLDVMISIIRNIHQNYKITKDVEEQNSEIFFDTDAYISDLVSLFH